MPVSLAKSPELDRQYAEQLVAEALLQGASVVGAVEFGRWALCEPRGDVSALFLQWSADHR